MTIAVPELAQVSFHEVGLIGIARLGDVVTLALEDVMFFGVSRAFNVVIEGVTAIVRNGLPCTSFQMEEKEGEVLTLRKESGEILLAIQWDDFIGKKHEVVAYSLRGSNVSLRLALPV